MCPSWKITGSLMALSVLEMGLGTASILLGVISTIRHQPSDQMHLANVSPIWSGVCFLVCGLCGVLCAKKRSGLIMILFSVCCICGLVSGILNIQFVRAASRREEAVPSLHLAFTVLASLGMGGCTLFTWLTCRLASREQQRLFLEREVSVHHSHEMNEKESAERLSIPHISYTPHPQNDKGTY